MFYKELGVNSWALFITCTSSKTIWRAGLEETIRFINVIVSRLIGTSWTCSSYYTTLAPNCSPSPEDADKIEPCISGLWHVLWLSGVQVKCSPQTGSKKQQGGPSQKQKSSVQGGADVENDPRAHCQAQSNFIGIVHAAIWRKLIEKVMIQVWTVHAIPVTGARHSDIQTE